jgi:four helix bundle protein
MGATSFEQLEVWKKAHALVLKVYKMSGAFPSDERFGLTSQLRRAIVSVPANIAEGFIKRSKSDKARFYNIAEGSLEECRYYFILARDLGFADTAEHMRDAEEVSRMLRSYTTAVLASRFTPRVVLSPLLSFFV